MISVLPKLDQGRAILVIRNIFPHIAVVDRLLRVSLGPESTENLLDRDLVLVPRQEQELEITRCLVKDPSHDDEGHLSLWIYCSSDEEPVAAASFSYKIERGRLVAFE